MILCKAATSWCSARAIADRWLICRGATHRSRLHGLRSSAVRADRHQLVFRGDQQSPAGHQQIAAGGAVGGQIDDFPQPGGLLIEDIQFVARRPEDAFRPASTPRP